MAGEDESLVGMLEDEWMIERRSGWKGKWRRNYGRGREWDGEQTQKRARKGSQGRYGLPEDINVTDN